MVCLILGRENKEIRARQQRSCDGDTQEQALV